MKTILIFNSKGGVGKTTIAKEIVMMYRHSGKRVLCVDLDGQRNLSRHFLQDALDGVKNGVEVLFDRPIDPAKIEGAVYSTCYTNIDILPSTDQLAMKAAELSTIPGGQSYLSRTLRADWLTSNYDICIIDVPPTLIGLILFNALSASDYVLIPMELSQNSMDGLSDTMEMIQEIQETLNPSLEILGIVLNKYSKSTTVANKTVMDELIKAGYEKMLFRSKIRHATAVVQAENARASVVEDVSGSNVAQDFKGVFSEIEEKLNNKD